MNRRIKLFILLMAMVAPTFAQDVSVTAKVDSVQLMIGDQTDLVIQVKLDANKNALLPIYNDTIVKGIEVLEMAPIDTVYTDDKSKMTLTQRYKLTSFEAKLYLIPPVEVEVDGQVYESAPLSLKVETFDLDDANPEEFFGPKDIMSPPFVWGDWVMLFVSLLIIAPVIGLLVYLLRRLADNKPIIRRIKLTPEKPAHDEALELIEEIKSRKSWQSAGPKAYYTELTDVLRTYMHKRFGFNALEMTSSEIITELEKTENQKDIDELRELFSTADLVKFAKHNPMINENDANLMNAIDFINDTKVLPDPEAKPEPTEKVIVEKRSLRTKILLGVGALAALGVSIACVVYIIKEGAEFLRSFF